MSDELKPLLRLVLTKDLILDLDDRLRAEAIKAFEMIRDRSGLSKKRARELEGQARFRMMEEGLRLSASCMVARYSMVASSQ